MNTANKYLVLVVEDDLPVQHLIKTTLKAHDYRFMTASTGETAIMETASNNPDMILLDLGLPDIDGVEVISRIRSWSNVPIIVLSARSEASDKIDALDAGADDYLTKPFSIEELLARLRVVQRRLSLLHSENNQPIYENSQLYIDYAQRSVKIQGEEIRLTPIEYKLLCLLAQNTGKVLTHRYIIQNVWGSPLETDVASLRVFMTTLRRKLERGGDSEKYIQTHVGIGYQMLKL